MSYTPLKNGGGWIEKKDCKTSERKSPSCVSQMSVNDNSTRLQQKIKDLYQNPITPEIRNKVVKTAAGVVGAGVAQAGGQVLSMLGIDTALLREGADTVRGKVNGLREKIANMRAGITDGAGMFMEMSESLLEQERISKETIRGMQNDFVSLLLFINSNKDQLKGTDGYGLDDQCLVRIESVFLNEFEASGFSVSSWTMPSWNPKCIEKLLGHPQLPDFVSILRSKESFAELNLQIKKWIEEYEPYDHAINRERFIERLIASGTSLNKLYDMSLISERVHHRISTLSHVTDNELTKLKLYVKYLSERDNYIDKLLALIISVKATHENTRPLLEEYDSDSREKIYCKLERFNYIITLDLPSGLKMPFSFYMSERTKTLFEKEVENLKLKAECEKDVQYTKNRDCLAPSVTELNEESPLLKKHKPDNDSSQLRLGFSTLPEVHKLNMTAAHSGSGGFMNELNRVQGGSRFRPDSPRPSSSSPRNKRRRDAFYKLPPGFKGAS